jgi:hypothetical protein
VELLQCEAVIDNEVKHVNMADDYDAKFVITTFNESHESTHSESQHIEKEKLQNSKHQQVQDKVLKWSYAQDPGVMNFEDSQEDVKKEQNRFEITNGKVSNYCKSSRQKPHAQFFEP